MLLESRLVSKDGKICWSRTIHVHEGDRKKTRICCESTVLIDSLKVLFTFNVQFKQTVVGFDHFVV